MVILNIDDDLDDREMFCDALRIVDPAISCIQMASGPEALEFMATGEVLPDYIFIDINMPKMDGYECAEAIRAIPKMKEVPLVMFSTTFNPGIEKDFAKRGIRHLVKRSSLSDLVHSIRNLILTNVRQLEGESKK